MPADGTCGRPAPVNVRIAPKATDVLRCREARGIQGWTGKWVSNVLLISITFSLVNLPAASSEIALR